MQDKQKRFLLSVLIGVIVLLIAKYLLVYHPTIGSIFSMVVGGTCLIYSLYLIFKAVILVPGSNKKVLINIGIVGAFFISIKYIAPLVNLPERTLYYIGLGILVLFNTIPNLLKQ